MGERRDEDTQPGEPGPMREPRPAHRSLPGEDPITLDDVFREAVASKEASYNVQEGLRGLQRENTALVHSLEQRDANIISALTKIQHSLMRLKKNYGIVQSQVQSLGTAVEKLENRQDRLEQDFRELSERLEHNGSTTPPPPRR